ncbi:expressed unknown protein [Seminavis robusta]|uniref:Uncharacterized protein n=1 Tax=Seminavis robusta TaxID=568900 RepID=A0A9N8EL80_9STRA|nr:expressed unknown protein [Seminavis robusta]|eukprot:Sro1269_g257840.1 n/a (430) ;mRNA; f:2190-3479
MEIGSRRIRRGAPTTSSPRLLAVAVVFLLISCSIQLSHAWKPSSLPLTRARAVESRSCLNEQNDNYLYEPDRDKPSVLPQETEPVRTLGGGADMIFAMARQMLLWEDTAEDPQAEKVQPFSSPAALPRWRPIRGVSDANPAFRTSAPPMNSQGYAGTIWRNVRKANKPSLWRHALRTYDRMGYNTATTTKAGAATAEGLKVQRTNLHHEGALVACAKLGLWKKAIAIYKTVQEEERQSRIPNTSVFVTENMVLSLIRACVRASKQHQLQDTDETELKTLEERRAPLDACLEILLEMEEQHGLPLVARHVNPIAAAYQKLTLMQEAAQLIDTHLQDRTKGPEGEDGDDPFNVNDVHAKDKGSYSLLVKGAVSEGNWEGAVEALKTMTEAGLYPNSRNLNAWTEVSERKTKQRNTRSWKKKRDEYWLESVR